MMSSAYAPVINGWPVMDRAALAGHLFNPGFDLHYNATGAYIGYGCFYDSNYLNQDSLKLVEKTNDFVTFFKCYVVDQEKNIFDTVSVDMKELNGKLKYHWQATFQNWTTFRVLDERNKLLLLSKILVFPAELSLIDYGDRKGFQLTLDDLACPKTKIKIDRDEYTTLIGWAVKDYVITGKSNLKLRVEYTSDKKGIDIDFNDQKVFGHMYHHKLFRNGLH